MMTNREVAKIVVKAFKPLKMNARILAREGCKKSAIQIMDYMTAENITLRQLGFMVNDNGRLVKFKPFKLK